MFKIHGVRSNGYGRHDEKKLEYGKRKTSNEESIISKCEQTISDVQTTWS